MNRFAKQERRRIAIIGAGFSGTAAAIHLALRSEQKLAVYLLDRRTPGGGLAHSSVNPVHRLNGPDTIHCLYSHAPRHFADWLQTRGLLEQDPNAIAASGLVFARRGDFGLYMSEELAKHAHTNPSGSLIDHIASCAVRIYAKGDGFVVELDNGMLLEADICILATGWDVPAVPEALSGFAKESGWIGDPWDQSRMDGIPLSSPVLLIGSGLTASDVYASLHRRGHNGPVFSISRHGLRPASQNPHRAAGSFWERMMDPAPPFLRRHGQPDRLQAVIRGLRSDIAQMDAANSSWHVPFDEMRDASFTFWPRLSPQDKRRFTRHLKHWYDAFRFRNPPQVQDVLGQGLSSGQLTFAAGRIRHARKTTSDLIVEIAERVTNECRSFKVKTVINCTGPRLRPSTSSNPLIRHLVSSSMIRDSACAL